MKHDMSMSNDPGEAAHLEDLFNEFQIENLAALDDSTRKSRLDQNQIDQIYSEKITELDISNSAKQFIKALLLLWNDHLDLSHDIVQDFGHPEASYIHGMMHRREGDYGNAKYWFRRAYPLTNQTQFEDETLSQIKSLSIDWQGDWDPGKFVDLCQSSKNKHATDLTKIQLAEFKAMLKYIMN